MSDDIKSNNEYRIEIPNITNNLDNDMNIIQNKLILLCELINNMDNINDIINNEITNELLNNIKNNKQNIINKISNTHNDMKLINLIQFNESVNDTLNRIDTIIKNGMDNQKHNKINNDYMDDDVKANNGNEIKRRKNKTTDNAFKIKIPSIIDNMDGDMNVIQENLILLCQTINNLSNTNDILYNHIVIDLLNSIENSKQSIKNKISNANNEQELLKIRKFDDTVNNTLKVIHNIIRNVFDNVKRRENKAINSNIKWISKGFQENIDKKRNFVCIDGDESTNIIEYSDAVILKNGIFIANIEINRNCSYYYEIRIIKLNDPYHPLCIGWIDDGTTINEWVYT